MTVKTETIGEFAAWTKQVVRDSRKAKRVPKRWFDSTIMALETTRFDASEFLDKPEAVAAYISEALETNDPAFIAAAIGDVARAYGMSAIADAAGVSRRSLYRGLSRDGNPELATVVNVLRAFGLSLAAKPAKSGARKKLRKRAASSGGNPTRLRAA